MKNKKKFFVRPWIIVLAVLVFAGVSKYWMSDGYQEQRVEKKNVKVGQRVLEILHTLETISSEEYADIFMNALEVNDVFNRSHIKDRDEMHKWLSTVYFYQLNNIHKGHYYDFIKLAQVLDFKWSDITLADYVFKIHLKDGVDLYRGVLQFRLDTDGRERYLRVIVDMYRQDGEYKLFSIYESEI